MEIIYGLVVPNNDDDGDIVYTEREMLEYYAQRYPAYSFYR
jgi:hypothetical protein